MSDFGFYENGMALLSEQLRVATEKAVLGGEKSVFLESLLQVQRGIYDRAAKTVIFSQPIVSIGNEPVFFPNTIAVVSAKAGRHKTRFAENVCAALLARAAHTTPLGLRVRTGMECAVVYVDTERNLAEQLPHSVQVVRQLAGYERHDDVADFHVVSLLNVERPNRFIALQEYLSFIQRRYKHRYLFVVLDVVTDCCLNFNDPRDTLPLVDTLNSYINEYNATFLCVIHQNPNIHDDKSRGHLGTELENKASTVVTLSVDGDDAALVKISCKKQRSAKPFKPFYAKYGDGGRLVLASEQDVAAAKNAAAVVAVDWQAVFGSDTTLSAEELKTRVGAVYGVSRTTAMRHITSAVQTRVIVRAGAGNRAPYRLCSLYGEVQTAPLFEEDIGGNDVDLLFGED